MGTLGTLDLQLQRKERSIALAERCLEMLSLGRYKEAERAIRKALELVPHMPPFHNNLAMALIFQGRLDEAEAVEKNLLHTVDPDNAFAKGQLIQILYLRGNEDDANQQLNKLVKTRCKTPDALMRLCQSFALLRRDADIVKLVRRNRKQLSSYTRLLHAAALANLGKASEAREALGKKFRLQAGLEVLSSAVERLRKRQPAGTLDGRWDVVQPHERIPIDLWNQALDAYDNDASPVVANGPLVDYAIQMVNESPDTAVDIVQVFTYFRHPRGDQALLDIANGQFGPDALRTECNLLLMELGIRENGEEYPLYMDGEVRGVQNVLIHEDAPAVEDIPEEHLDLYEQSVEAMRDNNLIKALALSYQLQTHLPDNPIALGNYAAALIALGPKHHEEAEALLHRACEQHPSYPHSHANLILHYCQTGQLKKAEDVFKHFKLPREMHPGSMAWFQTANAHLLHTQGDLEGARESLEQAEKMDPEHKGIPKIRRKLFPDEGPVPPQ